jgi:hypothetical protein
LTDQLINNGSTIVSIKPHAKKDAMDQIICSDYLGIRCRSLKAMARIRQDATGALVTNRGNAVGTLCASSKSAQYERAPRRMPIDATAIRGGCRLAVTTAGQLDG